jgi:uncharacterized protein involved in propanediol utilization
LRSRPLSPTVSPAATQWPQPAGIRQATGRAHGHHGEILQGAFRVDGAVLGGLVTLPCPALWSEVTVALRSDPAGALQVMPAWKTKACRAVRLTLERLGVEGVGGMVSINSNIAPGRGYGSSTSDVAAAIRATLRAASRSLAREAIAGLAVAAEGASDATFWDRPVLFAQRQGRVIEDYKSPLPPLEVLAFQTDGAGIDTLALPVPRYDDLEIERFDRLRSLLRLALARSDARGVAAVASESALISQRYLSQPGFDGITAAARRAGALGVQVAHSGEVGGLLFETGPWTERSIERAREELDSLGLRPWRFHPRRARAAA